MQLKIVCTALKRKCAHCRSSTNTEQCYFCQKKNLFVYMLRLRGTLLFFPPVITPLYSPFWMNERAECSKNRHPWYEVKCRVQNKNPAMNDVTAGYKIRIQHFTSYQGCRFLLHSDCALIQTGLYKGVIAGKWLFLGRLLEGKKY